MKERTILNNMEKTNLELLEEWVESCPFDYHQAGFAEKRIKGTLRFTGKEDKTRPIYTFYLPEEKTDDFPF